MILWVYLRSPGVVKGSQRGTTPHLMHYEFHKDWPSMKGPVPVPQFLVLGLEVHPLMSCGPAIKVAYADVSILDCTVRALDEGRRAMHSHTL